MSKFGAVRHVVGDAMPPAVCARLGPYKICKGVPPKYTDQVMAREWVLPGCQWRSWHELEALAKENGWRPPELWR